MKLQLGMNEATPEYEGSIWHCRWQWMELQRWRERAKAQTKAMEEVVVGGRHSYYSSRQRYNGGQGLGFSRAVAANQIGWGCRWRRVERTKVIDVRFHFTFVFFSWVGQGRGLDNVRVTTLVGSIEPSSTSYWTKVWTWSNLARALARRAWCLGSGKHLSSTSLKCNA